MREVGTAGDNSGVSEGESLLSYREQGQLWNILGVKHSAGDGEVEKGQEARWGLELHNSYL